MEIRNKGTSVIIQIEELGEINSLLRDCFLFLEKHGLFTAETEHLRKGIRKNCIKFEDLQSRLEAYKVEGSGVVAAINNAALGQDNPRNAPSNR